MQSNQNLPKLRHKLIDTRYLVQFFTRKNFRYKVTFMEFRSRSKLFAKANMMISIYCGSPLCYFLLFFFFLHRRWFLGVNNIAETLNPCCPKARLQLSKTFPLSDIGSTSSLIDIRNITGSCFIQEAY